MPEAPNPVLEAFDKFWFENMDSLVLGGRSPKDVAKLAFLAGVLTSKEELQESLEINRNLLNMCEVYKGGMETYKKALEGQQTLIQRAAKEIKEIVFPPTAPGKSPGAV